MAKLVIWPDLLQDTEEFVRSALVDNDASHNFDHIKRVVANTKNLADLEGLGPQQKDLALLCALLHDIEDWKYSGSETAGVEAAVKYLQDQGAANELCDRVGSIIKRVSFHDEIGRNTSDLGEEDKVLAIVQDADRLDAIGAIGIARTFTYGGAKKRELYNDDTPRQSTCTSQMVSKENYMNGQSHMCTIGHFHDKLLHLKSLMKTNSGSVIAEQRHAFMESFLGQFWGEIEGRR
eukprot:UC4_evm2s228